MADRCIGGHHDIYRLSSLHEACGCDHYANRLGVFAAALLSLPLWYWTSDPLWAVVLLTAIDVAGFGPTVRKAYQFPYSESLLFFALLTLRNVLVMLALENLSVTTLLFPAVMLVICVFMITLIAYRRRVVAA